MTAPRPYHDPRLRKLLLFGAILAFAWALFAALTGGIDTRIAGIVVRARGASRPLLIGFALLVAYTASNRGAVARALDRAAELFARVAVPIAIVAALAVGTASVKYGSFTAGGSDSYGYVSEAYGWVRGELPALIPLPLASSTPSDDMMQIPLGYHEGPRPHTMVPTYAPGLPLLMAAGIVLVGACGPFLVVPACGVLLVWSTFLLGRRAAGPTGGAIAAIVIATTPVVLFQAMAPMSDVPAGAVWTAALVASLAGSRGYALGGGVLTAVGLLIRPNLLPLAVVPAIAAASGAQGRERWFRAALVLVPAMAAQLSIFALHTFWYGSPLGSGYGRTADLYAIANIWPNATLYASWFLQSESPWAIVGVLALLPIAWRHANKRAIAMSALMVAGTVGAYLAYAPFDAWWYLRFLLPAGGAAAALIAVGIITLARAVPAPWGRLAACATVAALVTTTMSFASAVGTFGRVADGERHYIEVGEFVSSRLPPDAVVFAIQHSGSLRFYGGRMTLRFDWMEKGQAGRTARDVERIGWHPYLLVDDFELPQARSQFGLIPDAPLSFPIVARMRERGGTTVFDLGSRTAATMPVALEPGSPRRCAAPLLPLRVR